MNFLKICFVLSILIVGNECGLVDNLFGTVKQTTNNVADGVGNVFSFGKGLLLGGIDAVHQTVHRTQETIHNTLVDVDKKLTNGKIGNAIDKMNNKIAKVTEFVSADKERRTEMLNNARDHIINEKKAFKEHMHKFISGEGIKKHTPKFKEIVERIRNKIKTILLDPIATTHKSTDVTNENTDGTGLIDIRLAPEQLTRNLDEGVNRTKQKLNEGIQELNGNAVAHSNYIQNNVNEIDNGGVVFRD